MSAKDITFPKLGDNNYAQWKLNMQAVLMTKNAWTITNGTLPQPLAPGNVDWQERHDLASGLLWLALEPATQAMVQSFLGDAVGMWNELRRLYAQSSAPA